MSMGPVRRWGCAALLLSLASFGCEAPTPLGAICTRSTECVAPLVCRIEHCRTECVVNRDCPVGTVCLLDEEGLGACSVPADRGCGAGGITCPDPLSCVNGNCLNTCADASDCPGDGECRTLPGAGISFCFALERDGGVPDAGVDDAGEHDAAQLPDAGPACATGACATSICVGGAHACAIHGGVVVCWGANGSGQLGDGDAMGTPHDHPETCGAEDCSSTPVGVLDEAGAPLAATALACADLATCAITTRGAIACWGGNGGNGPLYGDPDVFTPQRAHVADNLGTGFVGITGGRYHLCAQRATTGADSVVCWGDAHDGQMGLGPGPVADSGGVYDTAASAWGNGRLFLGEEVTCGVRDGAIACAGMNDSGQLGALATHFPADEDTPVPSPAMTSAAIEMAVGNGHACALLADHTIVCRGWSTAGAIGRAITTDDCDGHVGAFGPCDVDFAPVSSTLAFDHVWGSGFTSYVCAREMGTEQVLCWGGTAGDCLTTATSCYRPTHVPALDHAASIAIGTSSVCAELADGTVKCIGNDDHGQLGRGTIATSSMILRDDVPVCFAPPCG